ncbi:MAG: response regulator [Enterocloster bolteae]
MRKSAADAVRKLEEIGVDAACEMDYAGSRGSWRPRGAAAGRPFSMVFLPYKMLRFDRTLTGEQLKRDLGGDTLLLLGLKPDEQELFEEIKQKGFKYTISLPLFRMSLYRKITGMLGQGESISGGLAGELKGVRLLVVEDNAVNLEIAVEMLSGLMGAAVDTARNGEEGCTRFLDAPEDTYDVILMDLQMPVLGGLDAARRIRESIHPQAASIPIIALTANAFEEDRREALEAGMNGFVPKPIDFAVLAKEIGRVRREGRSLRLLLAEDNELNREIAAELIRADGQQVDAVENGQPGTGAHISMLQIGTYDAILLDLRMPVMDGFEAVAAIRGSQRKSAGTIPVFAFTSSSEDEVRSEAARAGFGAVLTKPINMEQLRGLLG